MPAVITKQRLCEFLFNQGIGTVDASDALYVLPAASWIANEFAACLADDLHARGLDRYVSGLWNCNKYSRHAADLAAQCLLKTANAPASVALALGEFDYTRWDGRGHEINIGITSPDHGETLVAVYFEPQLQRIINPERKKNTECQARF